MINTKLRTEIARYNSEQLYDTTNLSIENHISSIDPELWSS